MTSWQMTVIGVLETEFQLVRVDTGHMTSIVKLHAIIICYINNMLYVIISNTRHLLSIQYIIYMPDRSAIFVSRFLQLKVFVSHLPQLGVFHLLQLSFCFSFASAEGLVAGQLLTAMEDPGLFLRRCLTNL